MSDLIEEMAQLIQVSISRKIVLRYNLKKVVPPIEADATQIRQVIVNLVVKRKADAR